jgi:hypothetical protein
MSQKSSLLQSVNSVSQVLIPDTQRHCSHGLYSAKAVNFVGTCEVLRRNYRRGGFSLVYGGAQVMIRLTPATLAVITDICADASSGYLPPGT